MDYEEQARALLNRNSGARDIAMAQVYGHDLACWCSLDDPCHASVLLRLANP